MHSEAGQWTAVLAFYEFFVGSTFIVDWAYVVGTFPLSTVAFTYIAILHM
jgi:hypothetical protein